MSNSYFGSEASISKAFDQYSEFSLEIEVLCMSWDQNKHSCVFNKKNLPRQDLVPCPNDGCKRGGFLLSNLLYKMSEQEQGEISGSERCPGDYGSPQGRKIGGSCNNRFKYKLRWRK